MVFDLFFFDLFIFNITFYNGDFQISIFWLLQQKLEVVVVVVVVQVKVFHSGILIGGKL